MIIVIKKLRLYSRPSIVSPADFSLHQQCRAIVCHAVAMAYEDVTIGEGVCGTMSGSLQRYPIATKERCSSTYSHILAIAVEIWPGNLAAPSYGHTVCALLATAAIVPADEQVVPAVLMEYEQIGRAHV